MKKKMEVKKYNEKDNVKRYKRETRDKLIPVFIKKKWTNEKKYKENHQHMKKSVKNKTK